MDDKVGRHQEEVYTTPQKRGGVFNKLYPPGPQPGAKGRLRNHCRKFWWCDCLILIIIVLVIVLPLIFVGIPHMAQSDINKSTLEVTSQEVTNPSSNGFHIKIDTVVKSGSSYHPVIDSFPATLSLPYRPPFLEINVPKSKSEGKTYITIEQDANFTLSMSSSDFSEYTQAVLESETLAVHLDGKTTIHLSGLRSMKVKYNKVITMKGLNKLSGLNITDVKILSGKNEILSDGSNLIGNVTIPNPSVMTLDLGNVTMDLAVDGIAIGYTLLPNLVLKPGNNQLAMQGRVDQLTIVSLIQSRYKNAVLPLQIVGNSSVKNGDHLSYYEKAIRSNTIKLDLNVAPALAAIGINITSFA